MQRIVGCSILPFQFTACEYILRLSPCFSQCRLPWLGLPIRWAVVWVYWRRITNDIPLARLILTPFRLIFLVTRAVTYVAELDFHATVDIAVVCPVTNLKDIARLRHLISPSSNTAVRWVTAQRDAPNPPYKVAYRIPFCVPL